MAEILVGGPEPVPESYVSPLVRDTNHADAWHVRSPQKWQARHENLHLKIQQLFEEVDADHDGKVSSEELASKLNDDDEIEQYMELSGRSTEAIFEQIDEDHDGLVTREEFVHVLGARGHTFTVKWLEEQIVWHYKQIHANNLNNELVRNELGQMLPTGMNYGNPTPVYMLLFELRRSEDASGQVTRFLSNETVSLCQRLWNAELSIDMRVSVDENEVMILIGIPNAIMQDQARAMPDLKVRLAKTKGMVAYNQDFHEHYAMFERHTLGDGGDVFVPGRADEHPTFAGTPFKTRWTSALRQQAIRSRMEEFGVDVETRMQLPSLQVLLAKIMKKLKRRGKIRTNRLKEMLTAAGGFREDCARIMGDDVAVVSAQVLAHPYGTYFPSEDMWSTAPVLTEDGWVGGIELPDKDAKLKRLQQQVSDEHMAAHDLPMCSYETIESAVGSIASYHAVGGPGTGEQFVGTLQMYIPLHDQEELRHLTIHWGSWNLMFKFILHARPNEGAYSLAMADPESKQKLVLFYGIPLGILYQPIDEIRDYFGDRTAMYFSWLEVYTKALMGLAPLGVVTMVADIVGDGGVDANALTLYYSVLLSLWSVVFLSVWKRREKELAFLFGTEGFEKKQEARKEFKGVTYVNEETRHEEVGYGRSLPNKLGRLATRMLSTIVILTAMCMTSGLAFTAMGLKYRAPKECSPAVVKTKLGCEDWVTPEIDAMRSASFPGSNGTFTVVATDEFNRLCCYDTSEQSSLETEQSSLETELIFIRSLETEQFDGFKLSYKQQWPIISAGTNFLVIQVMGLLYEEVAYWLNDLENYRTDTEFNDALIVKNFLFQFVNNYFVLFYIAYLRQIEFMGSKKECNKSCLGELQLQMMIVFTGKTFGLQIVEVLKPFIMEKLDTALELRRSEKMRKNEQALQQHQQHQQQQLQLLHHSEHDDDTLAAHEQAHAERRAMYHKMRSAKHTSDSKARMGYYEHQTHMINYEKKGTFDDFNEMAIQYGYVALFSPCFPLAPLFAFLNNVTEIRGDAWKLCKGYQRPNAYPQEDIGSWYSVLNIIGFIAVLTNATMIAFVGSQIAQQDWIQGQWMDGHVANMMNEHGTLENPVSGIMMRLQVAPLWVYAILVEHGVFITRVCILLAFPLTPVWISDAKDVKNFRMKKFKEEAKARDDEMHMKISNQNWTVNILGLKMRRHQPKPIVPLREKMHRFATTHWHTKKTTSTSSQKMGSAKSNGRKKGKPSGEVVFVNPLDTLSNDPED